VGREGIRARGIDLYLLARHGARGDGAPITGRRAPPTLAEARHIPVGWLPCGCVPDMGHRTSYRRTGNGVVFEPGHTDDRLTATTWLVPDPYAGEMAGLLREPIGRPLFDLVESAGGEGGGYEAVPIRFECLHRRGTRRVVAAGLDDP
jgi:hypothetical protein